MKLNFPYFFIISFVFYFTFFIITEINAQGSPEDENKLKQIEEEFVQINSVFENITEKMADIKYNFILKFRYRRLLKKKGKIEKKISVLKSNNEIKKNNYNDLIEFVYSYKKSCNKFMSLYEDFENLKNIIIKIIKIFFLTLIIVIVLTLIISSLVYLYIIRKRKKYDILKEEMSHSHFQNWNDSELESIKDKKGKKKKSKKHSKKKKIKEEEDDNDIDENDKNKENNKIENIEVLDEK